MFDFFIPIFSAGSDILSGNTVRLTFRDVKDFSKLPDISKPTNHTIFGHGIQILKTEKLVSERRYRVTLRLV